MVVELVILDLFLKLMQMETHPLQIQYKVILEDGELYYHQVVQVVVAVVVLL